jgi:hypothetical protein
MQIGQISNTYNIINHATKHILRLLCWQYLPYFVAYDVNISIANKPNFQSIISWWPLGVIVQQSAITTSSTVCNTRTWIQFSSSPSGQSLSWLLIKYIIHNDYIRKCNITCQKIVDLVYRTMRT